MTTKPLAKVLPFPSKGRIKPLAPGEGKSLVAVKTDVLSLIPRDQWERPLIVPPPGADLSTYPPLVPLKDGTGRMGCAYRRASTVAEIITDHHGLDKYHMRLVAEGLAQRPDLVQSIHIAKGPKDIGKIAEEAIEAAGGSVASRNGSTMHGLTEMLDLGHPIPKGLPDNIRAMLEAYQEKMEGWEILDTERFVVCDKIHVAGTYDRKLRQKSTGRVVLGDLKTGQNPKYLTVKTPAQVAVYAAGDYYDLDAERTPHGAEPDWGVLVHLPWVDNAKDAECDVRWLDLRHGRRAIKAAFKMDELNKLSIDVVMPRVRD